MNNSNTEHEGFTGQVPPPSAFGSNTTVVLTNELVKPQLNQAPVLANHADIRAHARKIICGEGASTFEELLSVLSEKGVMTHFPLPTPKAITKWKTDTERSFGETADFRPLVKRESYLFIGVGLVVAFLATLFCGGLFYFFEAPPAKVGLSIVFIVFGFWLIFCIIHSRRRQFTIATSNPAIVIDQIPIETLITVIHVAHAIRRKNCPFSLEVLHPRKEVRYGNGTSEMQNILHTGCLQITHTSANTRTSTQEVRGVLTW